MSITIPSAMKEIEVYKIEDKHFLCIDIGSKVVRLCVEELEMSPLAISLFCKWIDDGLKESKENNERNKNENAG